MDVALRTQDSLPSDPRNAEGRLAFPLLGVQSVPDDAGHRYEMSLAGSRLEAFLGFRDAGCDDMRLELYLLVDVAGTARPAGLVLLPLVLSGLLLLTVATVPVSLALARRMERDHAEQRAVREYGLAAADRARVRPQALEENKMRFDAEVRTGRDDPERGRRDSSQLGSTFPVSGLTALDHAATA